MNTSVPSQQDLGDPAATLARRLVMLDAVTTAISEPLELPDLLDRALNTVLELTGVDGGGVFLFDEHTHDLHLTVHKGVSRELVDSFSANPGQVLRGLAGDPNAAVIVRELAGRSYRPEVAQEGIRAYAGIPLHVRGQVLGVLVALSRTHTDFHVADVGLLVSIG